MDGFNDAFGGSGTNGEVDPAAEFLAREQSILEGFEDPPSSTNTTLPILSNGIDSTPTPLPKQEGGEHELDSGFEMVHHSSFDSPSSEINLINNSPSTGGINGTYDLSTPNNGISGSASPIPSSFSDVPREEPEKIKRWREEQKKRLEQKDKDEEKKKMEMKEAARKELEEWYSNHEDQVAKNRNNNRSAEKELIADSEPMEAGTEWERIAKLCDFNPKGSKHSKDISRMRSIILQVKQSPPIKLNNTPSSSSTSNGPTSKK